MSTFGWIVLIVFALVGFAVVLYAFLEFLIVQIRLFSMKIHGELEIMRDDNKKSKELKRARLETERKEKDKMATKKLNARLAKLHNKNDAAVEKIEQKTVIAAE